MKTICHVLIVSLFPLLLFGQRTNKSHSNLKQNYLNIAVRYDKATAHDSLRITFDPFHSPFRDNLSQKYLLVGRSTDQKFHFKIPVTSSYGYFEIVKVISQYESKNRIMKADSSLNDLGILILTQPYYWEKGDNINISIKTHLYDSTGISNDFFDHYKLFLQFSGKGSEKYTIKEKTDSAFQMGEMIPSCRNLHLYDCMILGKNKAVNELNKYKKNLTVSAYNVLKANILFDGSEGMFSLMKHELFNNLDTLKKQGVLNSKPDYSSIDSVVFHSKIPVEYLSRSLYFPRYVINYISFKEKIARGERRGGREPDGNKIYFAIRRQFKGILRDQIIATFFEDFFTSNSSVFIFNDALRIVRTPLFLTKIEMLKEVKNKGVDAYDFSLPDVSGKYYSLSDFKGKVVVLDFWFTGCGGCAGLFGTVLSNVEESFKNNENVVFISISVDQNKDLWISALKGGKYTKKDGINLLIDKNQSTALLNHYRPTAYPTLVLIDQSGKIISNNSSYLYKNETLTDAINKSLLK